jgi:Double zinc ribbon
MDIGPWEVFGLLVAVIVVLVAWRFTGASTAARVAPPRRQMPAPAPAVVVPPVICPACQTSNTGGNRFCSECGASLAPPPPEGITCPSCATVNPPGQAFCGQCGTRLTPDSHTSVA